MRIIYYAFVVHLLISGQAFAATIVWTNSLGGNWSIAENWQPMQVPGAADTAVITNNGDYTVRLDIDPTIAGLTFGGSTGTQTLLINGRTLILNGPSTAGTNTVVELNGGTISGLGSFVLNGQLNWTGGSMVGSGATVIEAGAAMHISGSAEKRLTQRSVTNLGTVVWSGTGNLFTRNVGSFYNQVGGVFDVQNDALYDADIWSNPGSFHNAGTFRKTAGAGITTFEDHLSFFNTGTVVVQSGALTMASSFNNDGLVRVQSGPLELSGGGNSSGNMEVATNQTVRLTGTGKTHTLGTGSRWLGEGVYQIDGATVSLAGTLDADRMELASGNLTGAGILTVSNRMDWTGGSMAGSGATVIEAGAAMHISGSAEKRLTQRSVTNLGTVVWSGTGNLFTLNVGSFYNQVGGVFDVQNDALYDADIWSNPGSFHNAGTFRKTAGAGITTFQERLAFFNTGTVVVQSGALTMASSFNNDGLVRVESGQLELSGGGISSGNMEVATNQAVRLTGTGKVHTLGAVSHWLGEGVYQIDGATVRLAGTLDADRMELASGNLTGPGILTVSNRMDWTGGSMAGNGATVIEAGAALHISGSTQKVLDQRSVTNLGTVVWSGTGNLFTRNVGSFYNQVGGVFDVQNDAVYHADIWSNPGSFHNAGTFRKTAGAGLTTFQERLSFFNTGTVVVQSGALTMASSFNNDGLVRVESGQLELSGGGISSGNMEVATNQTVRLTGTGKTHTLGAGSHWLGEGVYQIDGATVSLAGVLDADRMELASGNLTGAGILTVSNRMDWTGGSMAGSGATVMEAGAALHISGSAQKSLNRRSVTNLGTVVWSGTGNLFTLNVGSFYNQVGGVFDVQNDALYDADIWSNPGSFHNAGTFRKTAGAGITTFQERLSFFNTGTVVVQSGALTMASSFNNDGLVRVESGQLELSGGGISSGNMEVATNQTVRLTGTGKTHTLGAGSHWLGEGVYQIDGATVSLAGALDADRMALASGNLTGAGILTVSNRMDWTGGSMAGNGATVIEAGAALHISGSTQKVLDQRSVTNLGTVVWSGTGNLFTRNVGSFYNQVGGVFDVQNDAVYRADIWTNPGSFHNAGTFRKTAGAGITTFQERLAFFNTGTISVWLGTIDFAEAPTLDSAGTVEIGLTSPTEYGWIRTSENLALSGRLAVLFRGGFTPSSGEQYEVLTAPLTSPFESFSAPGISPLEYINLMHEPQRVLLEVIDPTPRMDGGTSITEMGQLAFTIQGIGDQSYTVESSTNLIEWVGMETNRLPFDTAWDFIDDQSLSLPLRFYRAVFLPRN